MAKAKKKEIEEQVEEKVSKKTAKIDWIATAGRRKRATARVRLWLEKNGSITVNDKPINEYFSAKVAEKIYEEPLRVTDHLKQVGISIKVAGGGHNGQLGAVVQGIANALVKLDSTLREPLSRSKLLTRDPREKERRKYGNAGKARAKKQSPKR